MYTIIVFYKLATLTFHVKYAHSPQPRQIYNYSQTCVGRPLLEALKNATLGQLDNFESTYIKNRG